MQHRMYSATDTEGILSLTQIIKYRIEHQNALTSADSSVAASHSSTLENKLKLHSLLKDSCYFEYPFFSLCDNYCCWYSRLNFQKQNYFHTRKKYLMKSSSWTTASRIAPKLPLCSRLACCRIISGGP